MTVSAMTLAIALAGCSSGHQVPTPSPSVTPQVTHSPDPDDNIGPFPGPVGSP